MPAEAQSLVDTPSAEGVRAAARRIAGMVHRTPIATSRLLSEWTGARLAMKCESLQRTGAFKLRGASNAVACLSADRAARGVATHSSGNHAAALACAAAARGIACTVVMPEDAVEAKVAAVRAYGAEVRFCRPTMRSREEGMAAVLAETGATPVAPFDDPRVIEGQGTAALELLADRPDLDILVVPVGGGGLLAGTTLAVAAARRQVAVFGAEPAGADDARRSLAAGEIVAEHRPDTIADGLRAKIGPLTFACLRERVTDILTVDDREIVEALRMVLSRAKLVIEPSAAVTLAVLHRYRERFAGRRVGVVLSGGNLDLAHPPWLAGDAAS